jgi:hypothetical protein
MMKNLQLNEYAPYQMNYIKLVADTTILKGLVIQKEEMIHFFKSIPVFKQEFKYAENKWTIKDILLHLIDAERIFSYRALRIARNDTTFLAGFEENDYVLAANANERDFKSLLNEFNLVRENTISLFASFSDADLLKLGTASNSSISVRGIGYCILGHELHHKNVIIERYL